MLRTSMFSPYRQMDGLHLVLYIVICVYVLCLCPITLTLHNVSVQPQFAATHMLYHLVVVGVVLLVSPLTILLITSLTLVYISLV